MELETVRIHPEEVADLIDPRTHERDLSKHHVTDLISRAQTGKDPGPMPESVKDSGILALGRIWEYAARPLMDKLADREGLKVWYPGPMEADGIVGSLDGVVMDLTGPAPVAVRILETKLRFSTRQEDPRDNWKYMHQQRSYCHLWSASGIGGPVRQSWMPVAHISNSPPGFQLRLHTITFSEKEIAETWQMEKNTRDYVDSKEGE